MRNLVIAAAIWLTLVSRIPAQTYEISEEELTQLETTIERQKTQLAQQEQELTGLKAQLSDSKNQIDDLLTKLKLLKRSYEEYERVAIDRIQALGAEVSRLRTWTVAGPILSGIAAGFGGFGIGRVTAP